MSTTRKLLFWIPKYGETKKGAHQYETAFHDDLDLAVEDFADYYHDNMDGWESQWPLTVCVANENGDLLGIFKVEREYQTVFSARKL